MIEVNLDQTAIRELNAHGCTATFDHLNEGVTSAAETEGEVREYKRILAAIEESGIKSNVSIKLTQFGLAFDPELAYRNARAIVEEAARRLVSSTAAVTVMTATAARVASAGR